MSDAAAGQGGPFDVAVVGAGVVGAAIARALARTRLRTLVLDAADDVGAGTSKANTAILHTGYDAKPGTLEARLVRRGYELLARYAAECGIPLERRGALVVAWNDDERARLPEIVDAARRNGCAAVRDVAVEEIYAREPALARGAVAALEVPDESIICPFTTPLALATDAVANGVTLVLDARVDAVADAAAAWRLTTTRGPFTARHVVNAAGLRADEVDRLFGHAGFTVTPRRGELIVFDKLAGPLVRHVVLPVPTRVTKGVLVSPTVFGNVMVGPTVEDVHDKTATDATEAGLVAHARRLVPALAREEVTATYVGLRAATEHGDYQIRFHPDQRYVCVGGIRSTGLTASMAIAEYVCEGLRDAGLDLTERADVVAVRMPNIGEASARPYECDDVIAADPSYGRIVCHCERVTAGEIRDAAGAVVPARSLDGLRRRTRATMGRCQGFYCGAAVGRLLAEASGRTMAELLAVPAS